MDDEAQSAAISKISELPPSLIADILLRLPVKTLLSCRCVCKTWLQLISDPFFVKLQFSKSPTCILHRNVEESRTIRFVNPLLDTTPESLQVERMQFVANTNLPDSEFDFNNSCNGLLCLVDTSNEKYHDVVYVCNPILGEYIAIPVADEPRDAKIFGFGFSSVSNQYKVLQTFYAGEYEYQAEVYTLGTGQWRNLGTALYSLGSFLDFNTFLNDCLHWVHLSSGFKNIACFDFESEQFKTLPSPPPCDGDHYETVRLAVLNGCLCASLSHDRYPEECDIWVMKEYGVKDSWTRMFVIESLNYAPYNFEYYQILFSLSEEEILMLHYDGGIVRYNAKTKSFHETTIIQPTGLCFPTAYKPCFVSLQNVAAGEQLVVSRRT